MSEFSFRVPLRYVDGQGVLYHGAYFGYADEARTEWLRLLGYPPGAWAEEELTFVVRQCKARYLHPIRFDDEITIQTESIMVGALKVDIRQTFIGQHVMARLEVQLVCVDKNRVLRSFPEALNAKFTGSKRYTKEK